MSEKTGADLKAAVAEALDGIEGSQEPIFALARLMESAGNIIAWQVAVVSPGFLGLLWNAKTLADHTRLSAQVFTVVFAVSELSFLFAIVSAVLLHDSMTAVAVFSGLSGTVVHAIEALLKRIARTGKADKEDGENLTKLTSGIDEIKALLNNALEFPWYVTVAAKCHGTLTIIGYVGVGIVIIAFKLF